MRLHWPSWLVAAVVVLVARAKECGEDWGACTDSQCCKGENFICYEKNKLYAKCTPSCAPGIHSEDGPGWQTRWSCRALPLVNRSWGACSRLTLDMQNESTAPKREMALVTMQKAPHVPRSPRIYCWALVTPGTYEPQMLVVQFKQGSGIFGCDSHTIISNSTAEELFKDRHMAKQLRVTVMKAELWVKSVPGPVPDTGWDVNRDGQPPSHLLNTPVFIKAWARIFWAAQWRHFDWTLKLDVDAFIVPVRLRHLFSQHSDSPKYLLNTAKDMYGNLLHGPVEAINKAGMKIYAAHRWKCIKKFGSRPIGEDMYAHLCLQHLQVPGVKDLRLLSDAYSWGGTFVPCDTAFAVFHPLKNLSAWSRCASSVCAETSRPSIDITARFDEDNTVSDQTIRRGGLQVALLAGLGSLAATAGAVAWRWRSRRRSSQVDFGSVALREDDEENGRA